MVKRDITDNNSTIYRYLYAIKKKNLKVMTTLNPSSNTHLLLDFNFVR